MSAIQKAINTLNNLSAVLMCADETGYVEDSGFVDIERVEREAKEAIKALQSLHDQVINVEYPRDAFNTLIRKNSPYAFYLFGWVPYQENKRLRLKMLHDVKTFDGREASGIWPNGNSCGPFKDDEVEFIRISREQMVSKWEPKDPGPMQSLDMQQIEVTDEMAMAFHHAATDGAIGDSELDEIKVGLRAALANVCTTPQPPAVPDGYVMVPVEPSGDLLSAMAKSQARDDDGVFPMLMDILDYSGENKTRTVITAAYKAMLTAAQQGGES